MAQNDIQDCITECEAALTHLNNAMGKMGHAQSKEKLQHATTDLQECISACREML
jgi:glutamine synthetase type III